MMDNKSEARIEIKLSEDEHAVLQFIPLSLPETLSKIESSSDGTVMLSDWEAEILSEDVRDAIRDTRNEKVKAVLDNHFIDRIPLSPVVVNIIEQFAKVGFKTFEDFQEAWSEEVDGEDNDTPDPQRGNLTPNQLRLLQYANWGDDVCPVHFNTDLSLPDVNSSIFFYNTRLFLKELSKVQNQITATRKGNLNRTFVKRMFKKMKIDKDERKSIRHCTKVFNEDDVRPLHIIKIICEAGGLINKRSQKFHVTKRYQDLLSDDKAGELYYLLFKIYFRKFNWGYCDRLPKLESLQGTFDYILYRISKVCNNYQTRKQLVDKIFLPKVKEDMRNICSATREIGFVTEVRLLQHLVKFGLLDCVVKKEEYISTIKKVKKSRLFNKFIVYDL